MYEKYFSDIKEQFAKNKSRSGKAEKQVSTSNLIVKYLICVQGNCTSNIAIIQYRYRQDNASSYLGLIHYKFRRTPEHPTQPSSDMQVGQQCTQPSRHLIPRYGQDNGTSYIAIIQCRYRQDNASSYLGLIHYKYRITPEHPTQPSSHILVRQQCTQPICHPIYKQDNCGSYIALIQYVGRPTVHSTYPSPNI